MSRIQWYPGHMHKASRAIREGMTGVDVALELLDARLPFSSANPMLEDLRQNKPVIRVMTRSDLADPSGTEIWLDWYRKKGDGTAVAISNRVPGEVRSLAGLCRKACPGRAEPVVAMVVGIPNVGKSSLINVLAGRAVARTGNEPAITRHQQRVSIGGGVVVVDTPGVLWPNVENPKSGNRLAVTGAVRETAMPHTEVAVFLGEFLSEQYPEVLERRYGLDIGLVESDHVLEALGSRRGCLGPGGVVDLDRAARILINDYRSGHLGRITLETPPMIEDEMKQVEIERERRAARKLARKSGRRRSENARTA